MLVVTTFEVAGHSVEQHLGLVRGITVRSRNIVFSFLGNIQSLFGGNISIYTELAERARTEASEMMVMQARQMGANAVIGMRYDATEIAPGLTEVIAYGTAVWLRSTGPALDQGQVEGMGQVEGPWGKST